MECRLGWGWARPGTRGGPGKRGGRGGRDGRGRASSAQASFGARRLAELRADLGSGFFSPPSRDGFGKPCIKKKQSKNMRPEPRRPPPPYLFSAARMSGFMASVLRAAGQLWCGCFLLSVGF